MRDVERLRAEVDSTIAGDPWYGPSVLRTLDGIDASAAAARPIPGAHTVWEIVLHMTAWVNETTRRVRGGSHGTPAEGDWPPVSGTDRVSWDAAVAELRRAHDELAASLIEVDDADLSRQVGGTQVDSQGQPVTVHRTVIGLLQHDAYHAGQVTLLKKILMSKNKHSA